MLRLGRRRRCGLKLFEWVTLFVFPLDTPITRSGQHHGGGSGWSTESVILDQAPAVPGIDQQSLFD